ncbi:MAG: hypothetical protein AAF065_06095 [Verrucomicrobiota bacterium]
MFYQVTSELQSEKIAKITEYDKNCTSVIESWDINLDLKRTLQWYWFAKPVNILWCIKEVVETEKEMNNISNGLLAIGCGPNGDDLLVDTKSMEVYFWQHESAADYEKRIKSDCIKVYDHLLALLVNLRNRNYIPWDSHAAEEYYPLFNGK